MTTCFFRNRFIQIGWQDRCKDQGCGRDNKNKPISGPGNNCVSRDYNTKMIRE
jgi:hypothetical protein